MLNRVYFLFQALAFMWSIHLATPDFDDYGCLLLPYCNAFEKLDLPY
ncbi:hypothetical protein H1P_4010002 [Hyella patelloides LEGE 07179]|uniref:Uncharacterized protein n=1 Tax=Hyella patelloides LEGE 07179 TaxID=945734 RepID=A0A563VXA4_9CYAN|nr:hypothetical protein H1P_4010002 [Hyella patelloides LEGE 07179]